MDKLIEFNSIIADASGLAVGLPEGVMGNSEVGHLTIGAGRQEFQDLVRINKSIKEGKFGKIENLLKAFENAKKTDRIHFLGLVSDGAVHSHQEHLYKLLEEAKKANIKNAYVHFFADGRDTPPQSSTIYVESLLKVMKELNYGKIATLMGRYYAMDRDKRWERIKIAYDGLTKGEGLAIDGEDQIIDTILQKYNEGENDEFLQPIIVNKEGLIGDNETLFFFDFRSDRMREIFEAFYAETKPFQNSKVLKNNYLVQMTQYNSTFKTPIIFPQQKMDNVLAEWLSKKKFLQYHTAETEKYAHVTFFFNGGIERQFEGEDRKLIPSPKVATYDLKPEMSVSLVADSIIEALESDKGYSFVMCNLAPPDMVGHTGVYKATVIACEETDIAIGRIWEACKKNKFILVITADHGNAEEMFEGGDSLKPKTSHTTNFVPFIIARYDGQKVEFNREKAELGDVAPTILDLMGLEIPEDMTGTSVLKK